LKASARNCSLSFSRTGNSRRKERLTCHAPKPRTKFLGALPRSFGFPGRLKAAGLLSGRLDIGSHTDRADVRAQGQDCHSIGSPSAGRLVDFRGGSGEKRFSPKGGHRLPSHRVQLEPLCCLEHWIGSRSVRLENYAARRNRNYLAWLATRHRSNQNRGSVTKYKKQGLGGRGSRFAETGVAEPDSWSSHPLAEIESQRSSD
jgi:hypothetical protein